jgi:hypothetical protein
MKYQWYVVLFFEILLLIYERISTDLIYIRYIQFHSFLLFIFLFLQSSVVGKDRYALYRQLKQGIIKRQK